VATVPAVRARLIALQRAVIEDALDGAGIVVEGRDIGSVVAPDADLKVYLTADATARAARRAAEEGGADLSATETSLLARYRIDSTRTASPLMMAEGAVHVDSTPYTLEEVVDLIVGLVEDAG
jgi:cytidylate kinase